jgi:arginase family enzyme
LRAGFHLLLDNSWLEEPLPLPVIDAREWGPQLRFSAPSALIEKFYREFKERLSPFLLYGSGDFHHLSALWIRRLDQPVVVVSFDNHPDWDVRPPKWGCGGWINRALELPHVRHVSVWGCGNFECWWPWQIFGNRRAEQKGDLDVHPWADDRPLKDRQRRGAILRENWREQFERFVRNLNQMGVYVTIDLDCLRAEEAITNWENGRFAVADIIWALRTLRQKSRIIAGDICGAFSPPSYARWKQQVASEFDHPKFRRPDADEIQRINTRAVQALWLVLAE